MCTILFTNRINSGVTKGRNNATTLFPSTPVVNEVLPEGEPLNGTTPRGGTPRTPSSRTQFGRKLTIASIAHSLREIKETEVPRTVDKVSRFAVPSIKYYIIIYDFIQIRNHFLALEQNFAEKNFTPSR